MKSEKDKIIENLEGSLESAHRVLADYGHDGTNPADAVTYLYDALAEVLKWMKHERTFGR
jgi:hypothetical protein